YGDRQKRRAPRLTLTPLIQHVRQKPGGFPPFAKDLLRGRQRLERNEDLAEAVTQDACAGLVVDRRRGRVLGRTGRSLGLLGESNSRSRSGHQDCKQKSALTHLDSPDCPTGSPVSGHLA